MKTHSERINEMTPEQKKDYDEKKKAAAKAYQERKAEARKKVASFLSSDSAKNIPAEIKSAIEYLAGTGQRMASTGIGSALKEALLAGPLTSVEIFQKFEYGTPTMKQKIREFIKVSNPEDRIWVDFKDGKYSVVGKGPNPPKGWTGYVPVAKSEEL